MWKTSDLRGTQFQPSGLAGRWHFFSKEGAWVLPGRELDTGVSG